MASLSSSKKSQQDTVAKMSYLSKLGIAPGLFQICKIRKPPNLHRYVLYTAYRTLARKLSPEQLQAVFPSTDDVYSEIMKKYNMKEDSVVLPDGTRAHWIGPSTATRLIINFHGGGYVLPASPNFVEYMVIIQQHLAKQGKDVAVLFLSYDLAPGKPYPRQLQQGADLINYTLNVLHKDPKNIVLTGDSAGANLLIGLMSHILHPHPSKDTPIAPVTLDTPFRAIVLMCPWVDFRLTPNSFTRNAYKDCIDKTGGGHWADAFMGQKRAKPGDPFPNEDYYNCARSTPASWWEGLKAEDVLVLTGEDEVLVDGITEFVGTLTQVKSLEGRVKFVVSKGEAHDQPMMDLGMGYKEDGGESKAMKEFLSAKL